MPTQNASTARVMSRHTHARARRRSPSRASLSGTMRLHQLSHLVGVMTETA